MFCRNCGDSLQENSKFCIKCGTKVYVPDSFPEYTVAEKINEALYNSDYTDNKPDNDFSASQNVQTVDRIDEEKDDAFISSDEVEKAYSFRKARTSKIIITLVCVFLLIIILIPPVLILLRSSGNKTENVVDAINSERYSYVREKLSDVNSLEAGSLLKYTDIAEMLNELSDVTSYPSNYDIVSEKYSDFKALVDGFAEEDIEYLPDEFQNKINNWKIIISHVEFYCNGLLIKSRFVDILTLYLNDVDVMRSVDSQPFTLNQLLLRNKDAVIAMEEIKDELGAWDSDHVWNFSVEMRGAVIKDALEELYNYNEDTISVSLVCGGAEFLNKFFNEAHEDLLYWLHYVYSRESKFRNDAELTLKNPDISYVEDLYLVPLVDIGSATDVEKNAEIISNIIEYSIVMYLLTNLKSQ